MTVLEASVRQALVARKSSYIMKAMASPQFKETASRIAGETAGYAISSGSRDVGSHFTGLMEILRIADTKAGAVEAYKLAQDLQQGTETILVKYGEIIGYVDAMLHPEETQGHEGLYTEEANNLLEKVKGRCLLAQRLDRVAHGLVSAVEAGGLEAALDENTVSGAIRQVFPARKDYIDFAVNVVNAEYELLMASAGAHAKFSMKAVDRILARCGFKAQEEQNNPEPDTEQLYLEALMQKGRELLECLVRAAAEIEADEVYGVR